MVAALLHVVRPFVRSALLAWLLVLVWMGVIYWMSSLHQIPKVPATSISQQVPALSHKNITHIRNTIGHAFFFAVLALLFRRAIYCSGGRTWLLLWGVPFVLTVAYGFMDEWHQASVSGRTSSLADVGTDAAGAALALLAAMKRWSDGMLQGRGFFDCDSLHSE